MNANNSLTANLDEARRHLRLLDPGAEKFTFQVFDDSPRKNPSLAQTIHGSIDDLAPTLARLNRQGAGVYVTVNCTRNGSRRKDDITAARAMFREADTPGLPALPIEPHLVVETSPGKKHEYIMLEPTADFELWEGILQTVVDDHGGDPGAKGRNRVLRLAGFTHMKDPDHPHPVRIVHENGAERITLDDLAKVIPPARRNGSATADRTFQPKTPAGEMSAYVRAALDGEVAKVLAATEGTRNDTLHFAAYALGQLVGGGEMSAAVVESALLDAALAIGITQNEAIGTIRSGMSGGSQKKPRQAPEQKQYDRSTAAEDFAGTEPVGSEGEDFTPHPWPVLNEDALYGYAGRFVKVATDNSEADPAAVLVTFLVRFGVEVDKPIMMVGEAKHKPILDAVIVGNSSKARKGTSGKPVTKLFEQPPSDDLFLPFERAATSNGPFSSGEGILHAVRDRTMGIDKKTGDEIVVDPGVDDKRLFILDEEFAGALAQTKREGNTLSTILRTAWDGGTLAPLTKNNQTRATNPHIGWVSHITQAELNIRLEVTEMFNGLANRILWVCARRPQLVPWPEPIDSVVMSKFQNELNSIIQVSSTITTVMPSKEVRAAWGATHYPSLTQERPGMVGCVLNRAEAQVMRLAMIYALLDKQHVIQTPHMNAALAFWRYCEDSALYIFNDRQGDKIGQRILEDLKEKGRLTATEIHRIFGSHISKMRINQALTELTSGGHIDHEKVGTSGRPRTVYFLKP